MFCPKCGKEIDVTDAFCRGCGAKIPSSEKRINTSSVQKNTITCPSCAGPLEALDGLDTFICTHCGNKVLLSGISHAAYDAKVDLKKLEQEERMQNSILSHEKDILKMQNEYISKENSKKRIPIILGVSSFLIVVFVLLFIFLIYPSYKKNRLQKNLNSMNEEVREFIDNEEYSKALESNKEFKKRIQEINDSEWIKWMDEYLSNAYDITSGIRENNGEQAKKVTLKSDLEDIDDMDRNDVVDYLIKQGFVKMSCVAKKAKSYQTHYQEVDDITIEGDDDCYAGEVYDDDVEVVIIILIE